MIHLILVTHLALGNENPKGHDHNHGIFVVLIIISNLT